MPKGTKSVKTKTPKRHGLKKAKKTRGVKKKHSKPQLNKDVLGIIMQNIQNSQDLANFSRMSKMTNRMASSTLSNRQQCVNVKTPQELDTCLKGYGPDNLPIFTLDGDKLGFYGGEPEEVTQRIGKCAMIAFDNGFKLARIQFIHYFVDEMGFPRNQLSNEKWAVISNGNEYLLKLFGDSSDALYRKSDSEKEEIKIEIYDRNLTVMVSEENQFEDAYYHLPKNFKIMIAEGPKLRAKKVSEESYEKKEKAFLKLFKEVVSLSLTDSTKSMNSVIWGKKKNASIVTRTKTMKNPDKKGRSKSLYITGYPFKEALRRWLKLPKGFDVNTLSAADKEGITQIMSIALKAISTQYKSMY
jgi:hypothetical protein